MSEPLDASSSGNDGDSSFFSVIPIEVLSVILSFCDQGEIFAGGYRLVCRAFAEAVPVAWRVTKALNLYAWPPRKRLLRSVLDQSPNATALTFPLGSPSSLLEILAPKLGAQFTTLCVPGIKDEDDPDQGLSALLDECTSLTSLDISGIRFTPAVFEDLPADRMRQLRVLKLANCPIDDSHKDWLDRCTGLTSLNLSNCTELSTEALTEILEATQQLESLLLYGCTQLEGSIWETMANLGPSLRELDLHSTAISPAQLALLLPAMTALRKLRLSNCPLDGNAVVPCGDLPAIHELHLCSLVHLHGHHCLAIARKGRRTLRHLYAYDCGVLRAEDLDGLAEANPDLTLYM
ncbi:hypothetical protein PAPYR_3399 [Paratrimastix pyriformis]|uniref:Uncharacterized protein n=1 Tax=Paratrimastix pyriformis TaxID=342808 RepID=A0ABQ8UQR0_9EUKA|nr:hypothetical protein PAPYR_3399 [Paratrimastix pyriformis]